MLQRVLAVSFAQVLRSVFVFLLPLAFIALIAWATAGSATGNTSDPMRAAFWLWLGAHHIPFFIEGTTSGYLSYLPIGAIIAPFFAVRYGFHRALSKLHGDFHKINSVRSIFASQYAILATILALVSRSESVQVQWYLTPIFTFAIAFLASLTAGSSFRISQAALLASRVLAILLGFSFIALSILIFINLETFKNITIVLQPGIFGGILLFALNAFYLPNAALALLGYFSGTGFAVGAGTLVSPLVYRLGELPALPLLAILPTTSSRWALLGVAIVVITGALLATWALSLNSRSIIQPLFLLITSIAVLGYLASGSLITSAMGAVGVSIWKLALSLSIEMLVGVGLAVVLPQLALRIRR
jgi:hypothetical protein